MGDADTRKALVVDDEELMRSMIVDFLSMNGYCCRGAADPLKVMGMLDGGGFHLVISDMRMQGMNGLDLLREIRLRHPRVDTIIMTAYTRDHTYSDIIQAGAADFIAKPFELRELRAKIQRIERERRTLDELQKTNTALEVVLKRVEGDKEKIRTDISVNLQQLIFPYLDKLKGTRLNERQKIYVDMVQMHLSRIASPFLTTLSRMHANLSHMEIQIANLIKAGKGNKEIAEILGVSVNTVTTHRFHLRTKLQLKQQKVNLKSYLESIDF